MIKWIAWFFLHLMFMMICFMASAFMVFFIEPSFISLSGSAALIGIAIFQWFWNFKE